VSLVFLELAHLQIDERRRDSDRTSLHRLARQNRSESQKQNVLQRLVRSRRFVARPA